MDNNQQNSQQENQTQQNGELLSFVRLVACPKRPDGTYNYCREALEQKAKELLEKLGEAL